MLQDFLAVLFQVVVIAAFAIFTLDFCSMLCECWQQAALPSQPMPVSEPTPLLDAELEDPWLAEIAGKIATVSREESATASKAPQLLLPPALQPMPEMLDLAAFRIYKLHGHSVVRVVDIPIEVPARLKRYRLHKRDVVRLIDLKTLTT